ncbi:transcriptional repressor [bacterium]|nr:transcriptional repressor [bacterium]
MNYSRQREIILETLTENVVHPTAEYLHDKVKEKDPKISLATLYRNLNQLAEKGIIKKIDGLEASSHFDHNTFKHYHFICKECGKVFDISAEVAPDLIEKTQSLTDFTIESHDVVFTGICNNCKNK